MIKNKFNILPIVLLILTLSIIAFAGSPLPDYKPQFFDANGDPLTSGSLKLCNPGTTNVKTIYTNSGLTVPKANPVNLDSSGRAEVWLNGTYDVYLYDGQNATGNLIYTLYNISSISAASSPFTPNYVDASEYGDLTATITTLGITTPYEVWVTDQQTLTANTTIPSNIVLRVIGGGIIVADGYSLTFNGPLEANPAQQIFTGFTADTNGVVITSAGVVYPEWWGAKRDGVTSDETAIESACIASHHVIFSPGTYATTAMINKTLVGDHKWTANGPVTIKYTGAVTTAMITLELGGDFEMEGPFTLDANSLAGTAIRINNDTTSMTDAVNLYMLNVKAKNSYSTVNSRSSYGILIYGAFNQVKLDKCGASNISRAAGLSGSYCAGIIYAHKDINCYARNVTITDPYIDTVTSADGVGDAGYIDMDGISVTGPPASDNGGIKMDTTFLVRGGHFLNTSGRCIKTQMESNVVDGITILRTPSGKKAMASGQEVDFQYGSGVLTNFKVKYEALTGGGTPLPTSWAICNASIRNYATEWGSLVVKNGEITNDIPQGTDSIPYFVTFSYVSGNFQNIAISDNTFLGAGNVDIFLYGDLTYVDNVVCNNNYINDLGSGFVVDTGSAGTCYVYCTGNANNGTARYLLSGAAYPYPILTIAGNSGFTEGNGTISTFNTIRGTSGGLKARYAEATANITASSSITITLNIPTESRILGAQLRVDSALATGELWDAAYSGGCTTAITTAQAVAQNTKVSELYDESASSAITTTTTNIDITKNGGGSFTAQGTIRAIVYYEVFATMGSL